MERVFIVIAFRADRVQPVDEAKLSRRCQDEVRSNRQ